MCDCFVQDIVTLRLDYCNSLLDGLLARASRPLQLTQKAAARLVFTLPKSSHPTPLLRRWLPLAARISILITGTCLQCCDWLRPYLHPGHGQTLHPSPSTRPPSAKRLSTPSLLPPQLPLSLWSQSWLQFVPRWWNEPPTDIRTAETLHIFHS